SADHVRLVEGELSLQVSDETSLQLEGADGQMRQVAGSHVYRQNRGREPLVELSLRPAWLQGYEGESVSDALGSLVAKIDGRDVPLTVGFHRVNVEIRDQIARTVIEESFVNNTGRRLEGVFYFPLPADASIAGFGMWIGDTLVEADIVEKQRAREIYETILREKRDPGLLEWAGGNLFKARVFPIEPHAEKKIKISYTQVLPLEGNSYRYSYALASDFLREHPLRELDIIVQVVSSVPLTSVGSPSHPTIDHQTTNAAELRYSAQDYSPIRDFEVQVEVNRPATAIKLIPHRRGDDGYFMLQLMPPTEEAAGWMRDVVGDSGPLALTLLCDTSASMDANARRKQAELVAALLQSLGANDRFRLAACDVDCVWFEGDAQPHDTTATPSARSWLEARRSLGWSNLKRTFEKVASAVPAGERVIYVGDGIDVAIESDPAAFAQFISQLKLNDHVTLHAVSVSSSYEALAMQAIASRGGGAVLQVNDSNSPADVARTILSEAVRPAIRDLHVQFEGLPTARVYPEQLPNLVVGKQQILLGRYLPAGATKDGQVVVSGMQNGKRVQFRAPISLVDDEQGNSFIPRLWARMHLDHLLQRGQSSTVRDDVIALSEEYHIITPYTSLLVLETDEDRERFKVQRRFQMRDGEKFFAEGRDLATYQLRQQQMKIAGAWRLGLRRTVLQQLQGLGRDIVPDVPQPIYLGTVVRELSSGPWGGTDWYAPSDLAPRSGGLARGYGGYGDPGGYGGYRTYGNNFSQMGEELQMMVTPRVITNTWESGGVDFESYSDSKGTVVNGRFENFDADLFATK
ncbi:MAG: hypothetical protein KDA60_20545, partial [Planctomycetales bacterium]|nr:hypothetical protein [Planctomycetales bacterium]